MRRWLWILVLPLVLIGYTVLTNIGAAQALASIAGQPIVALLREGQRVPVPPSGRPARDGEAQLLGGAGVYFGYRFTYLLPTAETVACTIRFDRLVCDAGWLPERTPGP